MSTLETLADETLNLAALTNLLGSECAVRIIESK